MIITLCGSTRFKAEFEQITRELTMHNHIVLAPGVFGHADGIRLSDDQKRRLDELHLRKIDMSTCIYVIDVTDTLVRVPRVKLSMRGRKGSPCGTGRNCTLALISRNALRNDHLMKIGILVKLLEPLAYQVYLDGDNFRNPS